MQNLSPIQDLWQSVIALQSGLSPEATLSAPEDGISTEVFFVEVPEGSFALRIYPAEESSRLRGYLEAHEAFIEIGACLPEILAKGQSDLGAWVVERRIEGISFRNLVNDPEALGKAARALAFLHSHERNRYGRAGTLGGKRLSVRWRQRFRERWNKIAELFPEVNVVFDSVESWFWDWTEAFTPRRYQLLHGDYHPGNLALDCRGNVVLLDFRSPKYGFGLVEMVEAAHHFCGEEPRDWDSFVSIYLAWRDAESRDLYDHFATSLHAVFHLRHADRFADLAVGEKGTVEDRRRWERNGLDSWLRFCDLVGIVSPVISGEQESAFLHTKVYG